MFDFTKISFHLESEGVVLADCPKTTEYLQIAIEHQTIDQL